MNWLAHLLLSEPTPEFRVGNLLPDLLTREQIRQLPAHFLPGVRCHGLIDSFTDSHNAVRRSISRIEPPYRRYGGILVDVFYDHFLANDWSDYSEVSLEDFAREAYASIAACRHDLPPSIVPRLQLMTVENWLCSYREIAGVTHVLHRLGGRLRRPFDLGASVNFLERHKEDLYRDFKIFFPELIAHVASSQRAAPARLDNGASSCGE